MARETMPVRGRQKSYREIERQADNLISRAEQSYDFGRIDRIGAIRQRYRDNISRSLGGVDLSPVGDEIARATSIRRSVYAR